MSRTVSPQTGKVYGIKRVCNAWDIPRSSFYHKHTDKSRENEEDTPKTKRGPEPGTSDEKLLDLIHEDLKNSPFIGEGHRKVWARLRFGKGIRVSKKRVLRIMREHNLLSPHRAPKCPQIEHNGRIITDEPNIMWATDGAKVFTLDDGWGWIFTCVEHWNSEILGWHVCKRGNRFAALEPISMAIENQFGEAKPGAVRGTSLRMDNGSQYKAYRFQKQIKSWGLAPSFAFVEQPG